MPNKTVTFKRWQVVAGFVALAIAFIVMGILLTNSTHTNARNVKELRKHSASIHQLKEVTRKAETVATKLEHTNCGLRRFLLSSAEFRARQVVVDKKVGAPQTKIRQDQEAVKISLKLANTFANPLCPKDKGAT